MNCSDYEGDDFATDGTERDTLLVCGCGNAVHIESTPVVRIDGSAEYLCEECRQLLVEARRRG